MSGAVIVIDQARPVTASLGTPGVARTDLWVGREITLSCAEGDNVQYAWSILSAPVGSSATLSGTDTQSVTFTPDVAGSYRIQLATNGGGPGNVQVLICACTYDFDGVLVDDGRRIPAFGELAGESNWNGNTQGWHEAMLAWFAAITYALDNLGGGGGGGSGYGAQFILKPSAGAPTAPVYNNLDDLMADRLTVDGYAQVIVLENYAVPAQNYDFSDTDILLGDTTLTLPTGATITAPRDIYGGTIAGTGGKIEQGSAPRISFYNTDVTGAGVLSCVLAAIPMVYLTGDARLGSSVTIDMEGAALAAVALFDSARCLCNIVNTNGTGALYVYWKSAIATFTKPTSWAGTISHDRSNIIASLPYVRYEAGVDAANVYGNFTTLLTDISSRANPLTIGITGSLSLTNVTLAGSNLIGLRGEGASHVSLELHGTTALSNLTFLENLGVIADTPASALVMATDATLTLRNTSLHTSSAPLLTVAPGEALTLNLHDFSHIEFASPAIYVDTTGTLTLACDPSCTIDNEALHVDGLVVLRPDITPRPTPTTGSLGTLKSYQTRTAVGSGFVDMAAVTLGYDEGAPREFTATATSNVYEVVSEDYRVWARTEAITVDNNVGPNWISMEGSGALAQTAAWDPSELYGNAASVACVYIPDTGSTGPHLVFDLRRYPGGDWAALYRDSTASFTRWVIGLAPSIAVDQTGALAAHIQFGTSSGSYWRPGRPVDIATGVSPLSAPILWRNAVTGSWSVNAPTAYPVATTGSGRAAYNYWDGAAWQYWEADDGYCVLMHLVATSDINTPYVLFMGTAQYATVDEARLAAPTAWRTLVQGGMDDLDHLIGEFCPIATFVIQTSSSYGNAVKSRFRSISSTDKFIDLRQFGVGVSTSVAGAAPAGTAGGVLAGTYPNPSLNSASGGALTYLASAASGTAASGFLRTTNATTFWAYQKGDTLDQAVLTVAADVVTLQNYAGLVIDGTDVELKNAGILVATVATASIDLSGGVSLRDSGGYNLIAGDGGTSVGDTSAGDMYLRISDAASLYIMAATGGYYYDTLGTGVTRTHSGTDVRYGHEAGSVATGASLTLAAQSTSLAGSTGGALNLTSGGGISANGEIHFQTNEITRLSLTGTGKTLYWAADLTTNVTLTQAATTGASVTGAKMTVESQSSNGTGGIGAELSLVAGAGTTRAGYITFYRGTSQRGQIGSGTLAGGIWFGSGNAASGLHSFAAGNSNTATNDYSIALGNLNNSTATASIALGGQNGIGGSADYAIALGLANSAQATASLAAGAGNITNSGYSVALGYVNTTNAIGSLAHGMYATTTSYCESAHGGGNAPGTPQNSRVQVSGVTTATASTNVDLKAGASADQEIITRTGRIYAVEVMFVATSNAFGTVGHIVRKNALIKNSGGTVTVIDQGMEELSDTTPVDWTITLSGSGAYLRVNFAKTAGAVALRCSAKVTLVDVAAP